MREGKGGSLPKIQQRRLKTEQSSKINTSNKQKLQRFSYNLKESIPSSEYLKNWLQKDRHHQKMKHILADVHKPKQKSKAHSFHSSKKTSALQKNMFEPRNHSQADQPISQATVESHVLQPSRPIATQFAEEEVQIFYNLQIKKGSPSKERIRNFRLILEDHNIFFQKMGRVINETLLRIGIINTYNQNDYVYKESFPIRSIGIILWGSVALKYKKCKAKFNCGTGNTIGQEIIFEKLDYDSKRFSTVQNGKLITNERCKAVSDCGILFIGEREYGYMLEDLIKWGFKDEMLRFQNILHRNYFKKREFKSLMN